MSKDDRNLSASDIEHYLVSAVEACTDYQGPQDDGVRLLWLVLRHIQAVGAARCAGEPDPELPLDGWRAHIKAAANIGPDAAALAEYARNDIIRREVERRLRDELKKRGLA